MHAQGVINLSNFADARFLRDHRLGSDDEPWLSATIAETLARLTEKILITAQERNELLRSGS